MGLQVPLLNDVSQGIKGNLNLITDVSGVKVGQITINDGDVHTGVTAILPHTGNMFRSKVPAASYVINGFGKSVGLVQIDELGTIETPIVLTNTFGVGTAINALTKRMLTQNIEIGDTTSTVNPVVAECNDGDVSNIRKMYLSEDDVYSALDAAADQFEEGAVGAGRGMMCYDLKGGIGSSSRIVKIDDQHQYTVGALVMTNYGYLTDFVVNGASVGQPLAQMLAADKEKEEKGSIITILATDAPLNSRQLKRMAKRATVGINRTGGFIGNGSGEIVFAFSTTNLVEHFSENQFDKVIRFNDNKIDLFFRATAAAVDESVLSSLVHAKSIVDRKGRLRLSLIDAAKKLEESQPRYTDMLDIMFKQLGVAK
ncbi:DmpA family aminopeptidase [Lentilactobacillus hilgardii]|uniref:Peptidase family T4 n=1 Tax=Lentilactobacillus hilgardii (strain ATCC 8290 / DSM 20176 / CCUG 30140 / JCM 1155 / KCTC 3500 / NBRC 15886 / NCIMB 8040 / NRRL B-1843 / 9) TaxID=1423757 RepID=C0XMH6_LENH9|nr:P1 family peptidase [Lentilactobacillus hilgardii]EEI18413.1 peptidase family T4 [Lentilactobacillus buchneri ATCC 11577]EEI23524.1 peptidase family T4 [Lentilactobacillus hilgardii DSM 20176 = ATCC 8290]KRK58353.1 L-aminopeptidase D-esterase [Lentilactobacillus hilgardii DSM 20176 = ATCC 8290]MCT3396612.1 S58 family peptidase [Lentilactobacillus hilgardii]QEU38776.1 P1 family peptidase [Lentilactobacillus hilgardii]